MRRNVGIFDVSHMGELKVTGAQAPDFLNLVTTNNVHQLNEGQCQYTLMCYENGTVVDDLIIGRIAPREFLLVVNASNIQKDFSWLTQHAKEGVSITDLSPQMSLLAIQGPKSAAVISGIFGTDLNALKPFHCQAVTWRESPVLVSRTGYTGEDGFEVMLANEHAAEFWQAALQTGKLHGIKPIGLAARDTLRLEAAFSLYGHEISDSINPLEAGLAWVVKFDKDQFIGKSALSKVKEDGLRRKITGFEMTDQGIARGGFSVYHADAKIGFVTSGTFSPTLNKPIGLALVDAEHSRAGSEFFVEIRQKKKKARVVQTPFYKKR